LLRLMMLAVIAAYVCHHHPHGVACKLKTIFQHTGIKLFQGHCYHHGLGVVVMAVTLHFIITSDTTQRCADEPHPDRGATIRGA